MANSEISLSDQLKDLNHRIKVLEKQLLTAEELRMKLEVALEAEKVTGRNLHNCFCLLIAIALLCPRPIAILQYTNTYIHIYINIYTVHTYII